MASRTVVVAEAADALQAHMWVDALRRAGIEASTFEQGTGGALGGAAIPYLSVHRVVVRSESLGAARSIITEISGAGVLSAYRGPGDGRARPVSVIAALGAMVVLGLIAVLSVARAF